MKHIPDPDDEGPKDTSEVRLHHITTMDTDMNYGITVDCSSKHKHFAIRGQPKQESSVLIKVMDLDSMKCIKAWRSNCKHEFCSVRFVYPPCGVELILEACPRCQKINAYYFSGNNNMSNHLRVNANHS